MTLAAERAGASAAGALLRQAVPMLAVLYMLGLLNIFLRNSMGVLAPELSRDLVLPPEALGAVSSAFFIAYAAMQVPTGVLLDRFGARRTLPLLLVVTVAGVVLFALAERHGELILSRLMMGFGCAGCFAGAFFLIARWFPGDRFASYGSTLNSFAMLGTFLAATPLALAAATFGWRGTFAGIAVGVAVLLILAALLVRDAPPSRPAAPRRGESAAEILAGLRRILRTPGIKRLACVGFGLSAGSTISGLWGGPYLNDVHGLSDIGRGNVLLTMAVAGCLSHFCYGQLARRLNTLKWLILGGTAVVICMLTLLALLPHPGLGTVTTLFVLIGLACGFPTLISAHARALVPEHLIGRGMTMVNMAVMTTIALMQFAVGAVVGTFAPTEAGVAPETAYRAAFAFMAAASALSFLAYVGVPDAKPRPQ